MNQQPDKLFREKLEGFARPVPASTWSRVEAELDKKNSKGLWLKIAAAVLLLAVAAFVLWPTADPSPVPTLSEKTSVDKNNVDEKPAGETKKETPEENAVITKEHATQASPLAESNAPTKNEQPAPRRKKIEQPKADVDKDDPAPLIVLEEQSISPSETIVAQTVVEEMETTSEQSSIPQHATTSTPLRIVYSAEEINDKYLDKKSLAEATSAEKKPSTLRKLIDKAYDLKNNEDPFGDLRQKKNEILALNFKNDKQERSENK